MEVNASSHPDSSSVVPRSSSVSSSRGVTAQEASNTLQQRGPSTEPMGAAVSMSQIKELSVGLTFRSTKRGFFIYVNDDNEKVFLDEHNRLHKLDDGYDTEEVEVVHLNSNQKGEDNALHADLRPAQEVDLATVISSEVSRLKQLESQITQQHQMLDQQYSQYQEYRQRSQQYVQYPQYIQQIEQNYRPAEQQVTGNQRKLMDDIMQVVQQNSESPVNYTLLVEKYGSQNSTMLLCNILQQLLTKQRENYQYVCAQHAEGLLHRSEYPIYQGNMEQMHQQQVENQYREQQQVWSQLKQLIHDELSLLEQLHNINNSQQQQVQQEDERLHSHQEEELKNFGEYRQLQNQQHTQALPHHNQEPNQQHQQQQQQLSAPPPPHQQSQQLPTSFMTPPPPPPPPPQRQPVEQVSSNQVSQPPQQSHLSATTASSSVAPSSVKFSGHFDPQRRPLYSDGASNYYRYNAQRQLEKVPAEELASLRLS